MINNVISSFSNKILVEFLRQHNTAFVDYEENLSGIVESYDRFNKLLKLGEIEYNNTDKLMVFTCEYQGELTSRSSKKAQYEIAKKALKEDFKDGAVFVFYDQAGRFRFSFIRRNYGDKNQKFTPWKRYTYFVEPDAKTNRTFIERIGTCKFDSLDDIQQAFSVEKLTKDFYKELSDWYFWAIKNVTFPNDISDDKDDEKYNSENIIRLITRLIFVWFLKQKGLIRNELFEPNALSEILIDFDAESETQSNYYRAILQNLFFATLNQEIDKRGFAEDKGYPYNKSNYTIKNLYRYEKEFRNSTASIMELFSQVPFLNGGLFECLDRKEKDGEVFDWDGFSRNPKFQARIPNALFFAKGSKVDLSGEYNDKKMKTVKVAGIIEILNRYNFTVEENTPVEVEVALDPELLGKVFENLLGAFNPETQETARKQTGSFYTPREIVHYMVDESLIAYFQTKVPDIPEDTLRLLFSYDDEVAGVNDTQRESLIQAAFECKILDPACGSGAFPMGILQQMVHLLKKLDPDNTHWNNVVMTQAMKDFEKADKLSDEDIEELRKEIEKTFDDGLNYPDYARKLHLIENCIYGVDIQSIAVQISKLRFFISLVCEQGKNTNSTENYGIRPLPNLETKFVAANTLIGLEKTEEDLELFNDSLIKTLIDKLQHVRHRQFLVTNATEKKKLRDRDQDLREEIETEVSKLYVKHKDENKAFYVRQKALAEKELELIDKTIERSTVSTNIFGEQITKTYRPNDKRKKELNDSIKFAAKKIEEASDYSRLGAVVALARQLTSWNPYDQNDSSPFFDPEWMFGLKRVDSQQNEAKSEREILLLNGQIKAINAQIEAINISFSLNYSHEIIKLQLVTALAQAGIIEIELTKIRKEIIFLLGKIQEPIGSVVRETDSIDYTVNALNKNIENLNRQLKTIITAKSSALAQQGGYFDLVIGNPPYGVSVKGDYRKKVELFLGKVPDYEIYYYFMEISYNLLKENGFKSLIIPNTFLFNVFAAKYREKLLEIWQISCLIDCSTFKIFEGATVFNAITLFKKVNRMNQNLIGYKPTKDALDFNLLSNRTTEYLSKDEVLQNNQNWALAFKLDKIVLKILMKIRTIGVPLSEMFPEISQGLIAYDKYQGQEEYIIKNRVYHYNEESKPGLKKWLWGEDITKYAVNWNQREWVDYCSGIANPRHPKFFNGKRLLIREITNPSIFSAITSEELYHDPAIIVVLDSPNNINNICAILNSNLGSFYHFNSSPKATKGAFPKILVEDIKNFPVRLANNKNLINDLVNSISTEMESNEYNSIQNIINNIIYRLYDLTYSEVKVIDHDIECKISEAEYNAIEI